jgi:hypothetical protein
MAARSRYQTFNSIMEVLACDHPAGDLSNPAISLFASCGMAVGTIVACPCSMIISRRPMMVQVKVRAACRPQTYRQARSLTARMAARGGGAMRCCGFLLVLVTSASPGASGPRGRAFVQNVLAAGPAPRPALPTIATTGILSCRSGAVPSRSGDGQRGALSRTPHLVYRVPSRDQT